jgi:Family of unknown function (DUF6220)
MTKETARQVFKYGIYVVVVATVLQFFLAGLGIFGSADLFFWHTSVNPFLVGLLPLLLVLVGWYAGVDVRTRWLAASMFGLVFLQSVLLFPYHAAAPEPWREISALHALNAVLIFWVSLQLLDRVRHPRSATSGVGENAAPSPAVERVAP